MGGAVAAVESAYMKERLVTSNAARVAAIEAGDKPVVGVNMYRESAVSPLAARADLIHAVSEAVEAGEIASLKAWRAGRDESAVKAALAGLASAARSGANIMAPSIAAAKAGVTTGEWADVFRRAFGEYRAPIGVSGAARPANSPALDGVRARVDAVSRKLGRRLTFLVGKPGLDGHSNGAEQIAVRARDCGMEVVYEGIRLTPAEIVAAAARDRVHAIGLSILSGGHVPLVREVLARLAEAGLSVPVVVGGIIPEADAEALMAAGVARVYTPKDFQLTDIMSEIVGLVESAS
jgi:(2R)-ethylmalonyl-CoA mutase